MVTAYEMQNKFLNKEVLELNQLRQQAIDREQKLFMWVDQIARPEKHGNHKIY